MESMVHHEIQALCKQMDAITFRLCYINIFSKFYKRFLLLNDNNVTSILKFGFQSSERVTLSSIVSYCLVDYLSRNNKYQIKKRIKSFFNNKSKVSNVLTPRKLATLENIRLETQVLELLSSKWNVKLRTGFNIINKHIPFLSIQCDGIGIENNKPEFVVEIKCPEPLKYKSARRFFKYNDKLANNGITHNNNIYSMEESCRHYFQIQLQLAILNLQYGYIIFYSPFGNDYLSIRVDRNENFIEGMLLNIEFIYNKYVLPKLQKKYKNLL